jgi:hypothetical protein
MLLLEQLRVAQAVLNGFPGVEHDVGTLWKSRVRLESLTYLNTHRCLGRRRPGGLLKGQPELSKLR